jgi:asparagine synthase (glutamine-hydrolysing)
MCGIAGIVVVRDGLAPPSLERVVSMAAALRHRGPDGLGAYRDARAALGHARLAVVDLEGGAQPMCNEDGSLWVTFNGEIFNHVELRGELEGLGHRFRTRSDTEVIVHAYEEWRDGAFARFNGQFAVALWDAREKSLALARDTYGIAPLGFCEHEGHVVFASETKAIFAGEPSLPRALDPVGVDQVFTFWTTVSPRTAFAGVSELGPGHVRTWMRGDVSERAFVEPRYPTGPGEEFGGSVDEAAEAVRAALEQATRLRVMRADVAVGSYLSGGLDSSLAAVLARRIQGGRFATFSLRFSDSEYDETSFQRRLVQELDADHHEVVVSREDVAAAFPDMVAHAERPVLRTAPAPLFLLSQLVREHGVKVVLTGEGADEMFAGYDLFREAKVRRFWARRVSSHLRPRLVERLYPYLARSPVAQRAIARAFFGRGLERAGEPGFSHQLRWQSTAALQRLFSPVQRQATRGRDVVAELLATLPPDFRRWSPLSQDQHLEIRTLLSGYLLSAQGDRMLMAHSVEGRFPFLDPEVASLADSLPPRHKLRALDEKHVLKRAAEGLVPSEIVRRKKQPYRAPDALAFTPLPEWAEEAMSDEAVRRAGVFDVEAVARLRRKLRTQAGQFSHADNMAVAGVLSTQLLYAGFVERAPTVPFAGRLRPHIDRLAERPL